MQKIMFGNKEKTTVIDDNGSTKTVKSKIIDGLTKQVSKVSYAIRHRTDSTDLTKITEIADSLLRDPQKLDCSIRLEKSSSGHYDIVECYTLLESD